MKLINTEEIIENDSTYIVETYDNGTVNKYIKSDPPEPVKSPTTGVQRGHTEVNGTSVTIPLELIDVSKATVQLDVQGTTARYTYALAEDALTVAFAEPVQAWINWEVKA
jgi:hypothetical protein